MLVRYLIVILSVLVTGADALRAEGVRVATFNVDATPPIGSPVAYNPVRSVEDPLSARGIVLLVDGQQPIVMCAVDWIGIANEGYDAWREKLAAAAGTTLDRVAVHTLHQHDGPRCDFTTEKLFAARGEGGQRYDVRFCRDVIERVSESIRSAILQSRVVTHIGTGRAQVEKVASNRRILGDDGRVKIVRYSSTKDPAAIAAPEGTIDPWLRSVSFWEGDSPIVCLTYYATHPQSYYGKGDVTSEFVGLARAARERDQPELAVVHFNGASGNVAAGKYNDGSPETRVTLTERMHAGMKAAWEATERRPLTAADISWKVESVAMPLGKHLQESPLLTILDDPKLNKVARLTAAKHLAWLRLTKSGRTVDVACLKLGKVFVIHMPGELFVEYQLAAQQMHPDAFVCMAAYGEYGPGYICTDIAYSQGGYESSERASRVAPGVESILMDALRRLLEAR